MLIKDHYECREVESVQAKGFPHPIRAFQIKSPRQAANGSALQEASTGFRLTVEPEQISMEQKPQVILALKRAIQLLDQT